MAIIAGIHFLQPNSSVPDAYADELRALVSRDPSRTVEEFGNRQSVVFGCGLDGFGKTGVHHDGTGGFTVLAGEPLCSGTASMDDNSDSANIHGEIAAGSTLSIKRSRGTFCLASIQSGSLTLATDKLGVRQMFYRIGRDHIVFSTALRILENLSFIERKLNLRGVIEQAAFGYPLGDRTPYEDIFAMRGGEVLQFRADRHLRCRYWKWDEVAVSDLPESELLSALHESFAEATRIRLGADRGTIAYLSGGLDSRCAVAAIRETGAEVHTFNFARPGTQDLEFGRMFAELARTVHTEEPKEAGDAIPDYSKKIADAWSRSPHFGSDRVERPNVVWSGEGGSVALGHVHLGRRIVELVRDRRIDDAIDVYFERESIHLSPRIFRSGKKIDPMEIVRRGVREELAQFASCDPARNFYLFLLLNDQRRKLHKHFENEDVHGVEFQLPFFDAEFIGTILRIPVDLCLEHRLYSNWLGTFDESVTSVPWQTYPGHAPCPLEPGPGLSYQWDSDYQKNENDALVTKVRAEARRIFASKAFPRRILSRRNLRFAYALHSAGLRDYGYLFEAAGTIERYNRNCC